ncbi:MAG: glutamate--tRNA ligase [Clostridium sp.]|nr:glutamate--tRNA ligase [Clostridium sp.]MCM1399727.1 glutamate--tRNA ligase [Clostridium sp.]MCM1460438.1 glutamate--tRNA ligase [Bacteroides sp.]
MSKTRTRFAPSPTGRMHVGNLRTALYAYLIAKHDGGDFILRIEDTDQERKVEGAVDIINRTLEETGLIHDEGPDKDGGVGPYVQSQRHSQGIYLEYAKKLIDKGEAYYCFCNEERLKGLVTEVAGKTISRYDKHCLHLSKEEVDEKLAAGIPYVIRQNNPLEGTTTFSDELYGDITVPNEELDDMILIKSDGFPTYNFANVVDDHLMNITHVVRGNEYLSSSPKYNRLYEAFGWEVPTYIHCPLITDEDHNKLSKRSGHSSFEDLLEQGFLTEAIVNFVALLGWCPDDNREIFSLAELVEAFNYKNMSKSPAVLDMTKLRWMNSEYIKAMDDDAFYTLALPYIKDIVPDYMDTKKIASMVKTRIDILPDIKDQIDFLAAVPEYPVDMYTHKKMKTNAENSLVLLQEVLPVLEQLESFDNDTLFEALQEFAKSKEYKTGFVMWPLRTAVSGKQATPGGATELMALLGKEETLNRIQAAIRKLSA